MPKAKQYWDTKDYKDKIKQEWFSIGQIDPLKYKGKEAWCADLTHEREVKDYIYKLRMEDAERNKFYDARHGINKYNADYSPINWDQVQAEAFSKLGRPEAKYIYSPFDTKRIDDYYFDFDLADQWCYWIENYIMHIEGMLANQLVLLTLEQRTFFRNLFGWRRKSDGLRRYSEVFKYIPRKNSKTFDLAALALGILIIDGEGGCKIVAVATCLDQAKYAFDPARLMIIKDRELRICDGELDDYFTVYKSAITANSDSDVFKPIAFADSSAHGGNFHVALLDELHEMVDDTMYKVCKTSQSARQQPIIAMITTAATAEENFCNQKLEQAKKVCRIGSLRDNFLPILYYSNPHEFGDDWHDVNVHKRVNPMYGLAKTERYMVEMHEDACENPHNENSFKRLDLNWITASKVAAFNSVAWQNCARNYGPKEYKKIFKQEVPKFLLGKSCYAGLDLAGKNDLCALTLDFPESNFVLSWSFTPENNKKIQNRERFVHRLNFCGEDLIDFGLLREKIEVILKNFDILELGFDERFATELIQILGKKTKIPVCDVKQSARYINEPLRQAIDDVHGERIQHNGCLLFAWQISNCQVREDAHECLMISKTGSNSPKKIDAADAWINARAIRLQAEDKNPLKRRKKDEGEFF